MILGVGSLASAQPSQLNKTLKGKVVEAQSGKALEGVRLTLLRANQVTTSGDDGTFVFYNIPAGPDKLQLSSTSIFSREIDIEVEAAYKETDLGVVEVQLSRMDDIQNYAGIVDALDIAIGDEGSGQDVSTMIIFSNDIYLQKAGYQLSQFRHRPRGYDSRYEEKYINGVSFNEQVRGVFNYASIGALNDMTRNGNSINYLGVSNFSFSDIAGSENINMRPGNYNHRGKLTLSGTNRNYYSRAMFSYNTGVMDNGFALSAAIGGRYAHEGAIEGVFYKNISYMLGAEYQWDRGKQSLSFVTFGSPVERGQQGSSVEEALKLVGCNTYNPNWGYQNGKKRNARVVKSWDPTAILSYVLKRGETNWTTGLGVHYNRYGRSSLNWYNGMDPRPDYYRYLPSYFTDSKEAQELYEYKWRTGEISQINWDRLYQVNHLNNLQGDGAAVYMVEEQRSDLFETSFNSTLDTQIGDRTKLTAGVGYKYSLSKQFKTVDDLLGAKYALDIDKFAERDFPGDRTTIQNDLQRPERKVWEGDIFGYDYRFHIHNANLWFQQEHKYHYFDLYYGAKLGYTFIQREGKMQNGRYPDSSLGKGAEHKMVTFETKGGATYKINGRHFLTANLSYQTRPPLVREMYVSPDITDQTVDNLDPIQIISGDVNYIFSTPHWKGRVGYFVTSFKDDMKKISYYHDNLRTFIHHTLYGVEKLHHGLEVGIEYRPDDQWTFDLVGTAGEYIYNNNPMGVMNSTNGVYKGETEQVYLKNLYLGGMPQVAGTFGIGYFIDYWFFNLNINGYARNHIDVAPIRRLASNYTTVAPPDAVGHDPKQWAAFQEITTQERFAPGATVDISIGKILYLANRDRINFNLSINNLLNKTDIRTGGFEQGRINLEFPERFTNKHYYMQGINFFVNASYLF
ncbi:MAG: TonB-dependent receptor [Porphyromonas sp.]|nr:TonB-dependent receptor [Porphyromonas sp.]